MLKLSQYTVVRSLSEYGLSSHLLVFNTNNARSLAVKCDDWRRITDRLAGSGDCDEQADIAISKLSSLGYLVNFDTDECSAFVDRFDQIRYHPRRIYPIFAMTTACNIGCTYCYEAGVTGHTMTPAVITAITNWVRRRIIDDGIQEIYPSLFGGEPLLFPHLLFLLMDNLNDLAQKHRVKCEFSSSSNGMLLKEDLARDLARRGLTQIQISLDGPEEIHNQRRGGKRGEPSFDETLRGIHVAAQFIRNVTLKVNFDRHNLSHISSLFKRLAAEGLADRLDVKFETIALQFPDSKVSHCKDHVIPPESTELSSAYIGLMRLAQQFGMKVRKDTAHTTPCMFSSHHGILVGPEGNIYKCISLVGRPDFRVGTVFEDGYDDEEYSRQMNVVKRLGDCFEEKCPYIPVCGGGCSYESIVRTGSYDMRFCTKEYLADFHFKRHLMKHHADLVKFGMPPIRAGNAFCTTGT